jgi:hypothetical protein
MSRPIHLGLLLCHDFLFMAIQDGRQLTEIAKEPSCYIGLRRPPWNKKKC